MNPKSSDQMHTDNYTEIDTSIFQKKGKFEFKSLPSFIFRINSSIFSTFSFDSLAS